jgi:protein-histidine pros-kinase
MTKLFDRTLLASAEQALDFIGNVLESSTEYAVIGTDLGGKILLWNEGARRTYGYEPEEAVGGANASILHTPEDVRAGKPGEILDAALREGKWEGSLQRLRKNGQRFPARVVITPRRDAAGRAVGFLLISKDVSDETRRTEPLESTHRDVTGRESFEQPPQGKNVDRENATRARDRFLANASHELRSPLNAIIGFAGTLLMGLAGPLNADQQGQLRTIEDSATHLLSLINDLLDLARIESGTVELRREAVVCQSVVREVLTALRPSAEAKGLCLEAACPPEDVVVWTDRRALRQVLLRLTDNGIQFTERGGVRLELARPGDGRADTAISVTDTGIGIRPEDQARLFEAFEQVHGPGRERRPGTGLGLHLSRKLAELLGAHIRLHSEYGQGSTFTLVFKG